MTKNKYIFLCYNTLLATYYFAATMSYKTHFYTIELLKRNKDTKLSKKIIASHLINNSQCLLLFCGTRTHSMQKCRGNLKPARRGKKWWLILLYLDIVYPV